MDTLRSIAIAILLVAGALVSLGFWTFVYLDPLRRTFRAAPEAREAFIGGGQWLAFSRRFGLPYAAVAVIAPLVWVCVIALYDLAPDTILGAWMVFGPGLAGGRGRRRPHCAARLSLGGRDLLSGKRAGVPDLSDMPDSRPGRRRDCIHHVAPYRAAAHLQIGLEPLAPFPAQRLGLRPAAGHELLLRRSLPARDMLAIALGQGGRLARRQAGP